jgi:hypothetical protein
MVFANSGVSWVDLYATETRNSRLIQDFHAFRASVVKRFKRDMTQFIFQDSDH